MDALGEIIGSDSQMLSVECHRLYGAPEFGGFVRADCIGSGRSYFAVVTRTSTGPFDGNRIVQAHRLAPGELEQRKPHLTTILRTTFEARVIGWGEEGACVPGTPPSPPRLHCFVYNAETADVRKLTGSASFLRSIVQAADVSLEDLLVSTLETARRAWGTEAPVVAWGKYLARLLSKDYVTLEGVLQRLSPVVPSPAAIAPVPSAAPVRSTPAHPRWETRAPLIGNGPSSYSYNGDPFED